MCVQGLTLPPWGTERGLLRTHNKLVRTSSGCKGAGDGFVTKHHSFPRLKLNEKVSLEKIKFHCMDHDGGSIFVSPVDKEILQAQKKVGSSGGWYSLG